MRVKLLTFRYSSTLGGFDATPLEDFIRDKDVLGFHEHFFHASDVPHVLCVVTWQDPVVGGERDHGAAAQNRGPERPDPRDGLDEGPENEHDRTRAPLAWAASSSESDWSGARYGRRASFSPRGPGLGA